MVAWHACPICCAHIQPHDDTHRVKLCVDGSLVLCICRALAQHDQPWWSHSMTTPVMVMGSKISQAEAASKKQAVEQGLDAGPISSAHIHPHPQSAAVHGWMLVSLNGCAASRQTRLASVRSARGASAHGPHIVHPCAQNAGRSSATLGQDGGGRGGLVPRMLSLNRPAGGTCAGRTHIKEVLLDRLPDDDVDAIPSKWAQVQAGGGGPDGLGPAGYGGLAQERAEPGARRGGRGVKHVGRQARRGYLESIVHIDASLRVSAIASCRPAPADGCAQTHAGQARGGSAGQRGWHHAFGGGTPAGWDRRRSLGCQAWA